MSSSLDIVCIGLPTWDGPYMKSTVQLMKGLAKRNRVLYVEYPFTVKDVVRGLRHPGSVPVSRIVGAEPRLRRPDPDLESLHVLTLPPTIPANGLAKGSLFERVLQTNARIARASVLASMRDLGIRQPIVINALNPTLGWALHDTLGEKATVYYCYDDIRGQKWNARHGAAFEDRLVAASDLVIATSRALFDAKASINTACALVQNGVDFDLFSQASTGRSDKRADKPVVGYVGSLDDRLDYDLLSEVARRAPDLRFDFVGRVACAAAETLGRLPNVTMNGPTSSYSDLPDVLRTMDVGIIPFLKSRFTASIYPMKINEYLAAGLPVVRTDFAPLPEFDDITHLASDPERFLAAIRLALAEDSSAQIAERIEVARSNSWEARVAEFEHLIGRFADTAERQKAA